MITLVSGITTEDELTALAEALPAELGVPGVVVGVQRGDGPAWLAAAGLADVEAGRTMEVGTPMRIASITKTFTATAVLILCRQGRLGLDEPMLAHLPELGRIRANGWPLEGLTVRHFLTHRAGIVGDPPTRRWFQDPFPSIEEILDRIDLVEVVCMPGSAEKYSNLGYALLGELVSRLAGMPYETFVRELLTAPAGMAETVLEPPPGRAIGYGLRRPEGWSRRPVQEFGGERPGGGMWSTASDLLRWAAVSQGRCENVLKPALAERLCRPETVKGEDLTTGRSLAWELTRPRDRILHRHDGGVEGFSSSLAFVRSERAAAVVLTNGHSAEVSRASQSMLGVEARPWSAPFADATFEASGDGPVGHYRGPLEFSAWIVPDDDGELTVVGPQFSDGTPSVARLVLAGKDRFTISGGRYLGEVLELSRGEAGRVIGFTVAGYRHLRDEERGGSGASSPA